MYIVSIYTKYTFNHIIVNWLYSYNVNIITPVDHKSTWNPYPDFDLNAGSNISGAKYSGVPHIVCINTPSPSIFDNPKSDILICL